MPLTKSASVPVRGFFRFLRAGRRMGVPAVCAERRTATDIHTRHRGFSPIYLSATAAHAN